MPVISAVRLRQEDHHNFKASLGYTISSRLKYIVRPYFFLSFFVFFFFNLPDLNETLFQKKKKKVNKKGRLKSIC